MRAASAAGQGAMPDGVVLTPLERNVDDRGDLTEIFRATDYPLAAMLQWNVVTSAPNVLRGVHCHKRHHDVLVVLSGHAGIGLQDLRPWSPTVGLAAVVELTAERPSSIAIPPGVAHGFYFFAPSVHVYGVSEYWDLDDELGCHWADPDLVIPWPAFEPLLSPRDATAGSFSDLVHALFEPSQH